MYSLTLGAIASLSLQPFSSESGLKHFVNIFPSQNERALQPFSSESGLKLSFFILIYCYKYFSSTILQRKRIETLFNPCTQNFSGISSTILQRKRIETNHTIDPKFLYQPLQPFSSESGLKQVITLDIEMSFTALQPFSSESGLKP